MAKGAAYSPPDLEASLDAIQESLDAMYTGPEGQKLLYPKDYSPSQISVTPSPTVEEGLGFTGNLGRSVNIALSQLGQSWDMIGASIDESIFHDRRARNKHLAKAAERQE